MAEIVDLIADFFASWTDAAPETSDENTKSLVPRTDKALERFTLLALVVGKAADIAADWFIVGKVLSDPFVTTRALTVLAAAALNMTSLGPGEKLVSTTVQETSSTGITSSTEHTLWTTSAFPVALQALAITIAVCGTSIELLAGAMKAREHRRSKGVTRTIRLIKWNRRLAVPRLLLDDLPATGMAIYLIAVNSAGTNAAEYVLLGLSVFYSIFALVYHLVLRVLKTDDDTLRKLKESGATVKELRGTFSDKELCAAGFSFWELQEHIPDLHRNEELMKALHPEGAKKKKDTVRRCAACLRASLRPCPLLPSCLCVRRVASRSHAHPRTPLCAEWEAAAARGR